MADLSGFQHPRFARMYERLSVQAELRGTAEHRRRLLAGLSGRVVEIGAGNGMNFAHYPPGVREVVAVEPEDRLRALAERAATGARVPVRVVAGHGGALPGEDGGFDVAVVSLVLCSVPDQRAVLAEVRRVLKAGGELRFYEHVRSRNRLAGLAQDLVTPLWRRVAGDCRPNRDTERAITESGLVIEECERFSFRAAPSAPAMAHILGRARNPAG
ncbi:class I SAM-dependent methyltransferase [Nonomuraea jiangxiensis]|uniref:Methyltransferase domain-containing protein n=1 Tax=Nonomuraea jiangxiensis TaxID=633440 RepID=A0A1G9U7G2_9ACTN|nr:class I SAM-dependent methyltransferase [Nonomuraea jiangxiensis]SDM55909.1 Methyltransferase domain-containing protein [Nonomuraea jiangxiensis]